MPEDEHDIHVKLLTCYESTLFKVCTGVLSGAATDMTYEHFLIVNDGYNSKNFLHVIRSFSSIKYQFHVTYIGYKKYAVVMFT